MALMEVEFGTKNYGKVLFDVDDYGQRSIIVADAQDSKKAYDLLRETMNDKTFIDDHCRNDDAVNSCIALHVLGFDPCEWFENFFEDKAIKLRFLDYDVKAFIDHVHRVCGYGDYDTNYLLRWGPEGNEGAALGYRILSF